jgi:hypothetical protein
MCNYLVPPENRPTAEETAHGSHQDDARGEAKSGGQCHGRVSRQDQTGDSYHEPADYEGGQDYSCSYPKWAPIPSGCGSP